ncbi:MAG: peptide/nickel transport system permease protein [Gaiellaceae bacterium]|nr:peptide/nickel transport system permease protein [Gaiellaceae bacterium]
MSAAIAPATPEQVVGETVAQVRRETLLQILRSKTVWVGLVIVGIWVVCAVLGSRLAPNDPFKTDPVGKHKGPSGDHFFGTDLLGRDIFSRVIVGARDILTVAPLATLLGTLLGTALGLAMGYFRGIVDDILSRIVEAVLALPLVIVAITALAATGTSTATLVLVIGVVFAPIIARTVRAAVLAERELEYVAAARLRGERPPYVLFAEILPNVLPPILVEFTVRIGYAIFAVATLSFLGFGPQPPSPDWGLQIFDGTRFISAGFWWESLFPAVAIASLVIAVNLISDGIQQAVKN